MKRLQKRADPRILRVGSLALGACPGLLQPNLYSLGFGSFLGSVSSTTPSRTQLWLLRPLLWLEAQWHVQSAIPHLAIEHAFLFFLLLLLQFSFKVNSIFFNSYFQLIFGTPGTAART